MSKAISEKKVSKKLAILLAVLVAILAASHVLHPGPALAQEEKKAEQEKAPESVGETEPAPKEAEPPPGPPEGGVDECPTLSPAPELCDALPPGQPAGAFETFSFELAVDGDPPEDTRFFGSVPSEGGIGTPLTDPDGDGTYTGSVDVPKFAPGPRPPDAAPVELPVRIVQDTGSEVRTIKDFGVVPVDEDRKFRAEVSFEDTAGKEPGDDEIAQDTLVEATGVLEEQEITTYRYGTHTITDEASGTLYALQSDTVDLDGYAGEQVTVFGVPVKGYENGQIEGGPPLLEVTRVERSGDHGGYTGDAVAVFELTVEGEPPAETGFFGAVGFGLGDEWETRWVRLEDADGDGAYSGSIRFPSGVPASVWIARGTGTSDGRDGPLPDESYAVIKSFGVQTYLDKAVTFEASVSFPKTTVVDPTPSGSVGGVLSGGGIRDLLPNTGGLSLAVLLAGVLLVPGGLLVRRLTQKR